jgi:DNA-binding response OmpR family regulator
MSGSIVARFSVRIPLLKGGAWLLAARGRAVSAEELLDRVWDEMADPFTTAVKVTISRLRRKLGDPPVIETVPQAGYHI